MVTDISEVMNYFNRVRENIRRKVSVFSGSQWVIILVFCFAYLFAACVNSLQAPFYPAEVIYMKKN